MSGKRIRHRHDHDAGGGQPIRIPVGPTTTRQIIKRHFREEGVRLNTLTGPWRCTSHNVYSTLCRSRPLAPGHIEGAIAILGLDEFDANELRLQAAREAGWQIDPRFILRNAGT